MTIFESRCDAIFIIHCVAFVNLKKCHKFKHLKTKILLPSKPKINETIKRDNKIHHCNIFIFIVICCVSKFIHFSSMLQCFTECFSDCLIKVARGCKKLNKLKQTLNIGYFPSNIFLRRRGHERFFRAKQKLSFHLIDF